MANEAVQTTGKEGEDLSMEEILQSIRKIIAEDGGENAAAQPAAANGAEPESPMGSDVLELTELVEETPTDTGVVDVLKEIDSAFETPPPTPVAATPTAPERPKPEPVAAKPEVTPHTADNSRLLSAAAASASAAALKKVVETHKANTPMPHFRSGTSIEDLVLETLKPMLKDWLDANLPTMVERIVEREIRKLVD